MTESKFVDLARRARERAIERGDAEGVARAETHLRAGLKAEADHYSRAAADMERLEALHSLAELGGLPRRAPEAELEPEAEPEL